MIWVEDGCAVDIRGSVNNSVAIISASQKANGYTFFTNLRKQKNVVIPEGVQVFGEQWFKNSKIESIIVPSSVKEIGPSAFCDCKNLTKVIFAEHS